MEGEDGGDMPPFWLQSNSSNYNRNRLRSSSSDFFMNSGFLIIILTITALFLIFIVVPSFLSFTSQYIKPHLVKKNWDSLNIVLVFFAIICGFLSRRTADSIPAGSGVAGNSFSNLPSQRVLVEDEPNQMHHHRHRQDHLRHQPMSMDQPWIGYSNMNPAMYNSMDNFSRLSSGTSNVRGMRRNSSSYPDLRQESLWTPAPESRRFYDDINVDGYQYGGAPDYLHRRHSSDPLPVPVSTENQYGESNYLLQQSSAPVPATVPESDDTKYFSDTKAIPVDTFVVRQQEELSPESPPVTETAEQPLPSPKTTQSPPPPPTTKARRKERADRRTFRSERRENPDEEKKELEFEKVRTQPLIPPPSSPPPPPPPPPESMKQSKSEQKSSNSERKSSNAAKDIKSTFASLYNQRKNKKKNKQKSKESFDDMFHQLFDEPAEAQSFVCQPPSPPPPPPPPPPPSSVFHQLFKKSSKTKKIHSDAAPPPPPPTKQSRSTERRFVYQDQSPSMPENSPPKQIRSPLKPESSRRKKPSTPGKPPLPASKSSNTYFPSDELYLNSGNQSPLIPMPPPPPPPPFKMSAMKFVVRGDFVRIGSRTSRSGSPELLEDTASAQESPMDTPRVVDSTDGESSIPPSPFCPSPDVDYKADSFIARFRAGLKNGN